MPLSRFHILVLGLSALTLASARAEEWQLCPGVRLAAPEKIDFTQTEAVLVCGDPTLPAWKDVPRSQALFHLHSFLQERGYYHPKVDETKERLLVNAGKRTIVAKIEMEGDPAEIDITRFRYIQGQTLTPTLLQETEKRFLKALRARGHACPKVEVLGYPDEARVKLILKAGPVGTVKDIAIEEVESMNAAMLQRYFAFYPGLIYDERWVDLTIQRIHSVGILQNTLFETRCDGTNVNLLEKNVAGPPRLVTIGFGINTEKGFATRASWKHSRVGATGSLAEVSVTGYYGGRRRNEQEIAFNSLWYYQNHPSRYHIKPAASFRHESQASYETLTAKVQMAPGVTWDGQNAGGSLYAGPALVGVKTLRGEGRPQTAYLTLAADLTITSHAFELYRTAPREGYELSLGGNFSRRGLLGELTAQNIRLGGHYLWNLGSYDPPLFVLGLRASGATTIAPTAEQTGLPPTLRQYLGGSLDLRGFGFQEIPSTKGALTAVFLSTELRLGYLLPWNLQPFVFLDVAKTGSEPVRLDQPWLYSPGGGLRWESPIGSFRASAAHGFIGGTPPPGYTAKSHFQLFISYGEEF